MNDTLNPDQIAALFDAAKSGSAPENSTPAPTRRPSRMRSVDFSRPTKFTADHQRRIVRSIEAFCLAAAGRLTAELRANVEFEVLNTTQVTWTTAQTLIPAHSLSMMLLARPVDRRMLMTMESSFALNAIECLLGGSTLRAAKHRRFSEIDWTLSRRMADSVIHQLSAAFHDLGGLGFEIEEMEFQTDSTAIASVSEPTFVVMLEARMNMHSSTMALMIPWVAIDPVADLIAGKEPRPAGELGESGLDEALASVPVTLRAEVAALELPVADILSLEPGSVIRLGARAADGISLYAENVKLGVARPGSNGARRAIQVRGSEEA